MTKIASWNVNSLKVRLPQVLDWLAEEQPDILALQETKLTDDNFPASDIEKAGYHVVYSGQKTYNGVCILSKTAPEDIVTDLPGLDDPQRRVLSASYSNIRFINIYVPNGQEVGSEKYAYKLAWLEKLTQFVQQQLVEYPDFIMVGDFNIAPDDRDVYDPEAWKEKVLCSSAERAALQGLLDKGLSDTFRLFEQDEKLYSWWDYRMAAFRRNMGLRIDLILASEAMSRLCCKAYIDKAPRKLERPSDHAPVVAEFKPK